MKSNRRTFLQTAGSGLIGIAGIPGVAAGTANAAEVTVTGQLVKHNGDPVPMGQVRILSTEEQNPAWVNDDGSFEASVSSNDEYRIGYYKYDNRENELVGVKNEVPHVDKFNPFVVAESDKDLGKVQMPDPYLVDVRVLDENGEPMELNDLEVHIRADGLGKGDTYPTDANGYVYIPGADFTGFELGGDLVLTVTVPQESGGSVEFQHELFVESSVTMTVQLGEGVTVTESDDESSPSTTTTTTATPTEIPTETATPTETPTGTATPTTAAPTTTTETASQATTATTTVSEGESQPTQKTQRQRGFFSNTGDEPGFLSNAFNLTVMGFLLSVAGIIHQMFQGR